MTAVALATPDERPTPSQFLKLLEGPSREQLLDDALHDSVEAATYCGDIEALFKAGAKCHCDDTKGFVCPICEKLCFQVDVLNAQRDLLVELGGKLPPNIQRELEGRPA